MKLLTLTFILFTTQFAQAKNNCWIYLAENKGIEASNSVTDNFIAFLNVMLKENVIDDTYLAKLVKGEFANPLNKEIIAQSEHQIYNDVFQDFVLSQFDKNKIADWAKTTLEARQATQKSKEQKKTDTTKAFVQMEFHKVEKGEFDSRYAKGIILTNPFEMLATQITQKMWLDIMGDLPFRRPDTPQGDDYPVVHITWWSAITYANKLSEKYGFPPVYDMSAYKNWEGNAAKGNLIPEDPVIATKLLKINEPSGDIYKAKGFRLPTNAEFLFVSSDRGRSNTHMFSNVDESNIMQYAWCEVHHLDAPRQVAELKPFVIDGKNFYDLYGNAIEWLHDIGTSKTANQNGINPLQTIEKTSGDVDLRYRLAKANFYVSRISHIDKGTVGWAEASTAEIYSGFRLVRSLPK